MRKYYKILNPDGSCCNGGKGYWPEDEWMPELDEDKLEPCKYGYHLCEEKDILGWVEAGSAIAPAYIKPGAKKIRADNKTVVSSAKRGKFYDNWNRDTEKLLVNDIISWYEKNGSYRIWLDTVAIPLGSIIRTAMYCASQNDDMPYLPWSCRNRLRRYITKRIIYYLDNGAPNDV